MVTEIDRNLQATEGCKYCCSVAMRQEHSCKQDVCGEAKHLQSAFPIRGWHPAGGKVLVHRGQEVCHLGIA